MEKIILVDGNNLLFRSYYATAYTGNIMRNKDGFPTNGLYGFVNMINKIISDESPNYMMVAFDVGKTFRHEKYKEYKDGRRETPEELKLQFPVAKKILTAMGIKYLECAGYEADDIIGTISSWTEKDANFEALIVSSDKDLLQLISDETKVKLLKTKDHIMMDMKKFIDTYGFEPIKMIDLKALMGDASDNIPGVKGIGEKTAIKLLCEYGSLDGIYENIDKIKGATNIKLTDGKDDAYYSKDLVTIYRNVPLNITYNDLIYEGTNSDELVNIYEDLGFSSLLKKINIKTSKKNNLDFKIIGDLDCLEIKDDIAIFLDTSEENYHKAKIYGMAIYNNDNSIYVPFNFFDKLIAIKDISKYTYDLKKVLVMKNRYSFEIGTVNFDTMIAAYLLNYTVKDDICILANDLDYEIPIFNKKEALSIEERAKRSILKAKFIFETKSKFEKEIIKEEMDSLFYDIEIPLARVLAKMEIEGIRVKKDVLEQMGEEIKIKLELISNDIYNYAGMQFNISSPMQLGEVLFEKLKLPHAKKNKRGYVTDVDTLNKLKGIPIIDKILEYRALSKLYSTYIEGIIDTICEDGKIHTIYTQTLTRTGRLSSIEPNLQNIPIRSEYGRLIRKAFVPEDNSIILSSDYSQIELRIFAHLSNVSELQNAFNNNRDIHTSTAMDIFNVPEEGVTKNMRRQAKAVNFGILYGISSYGLSEDLGISVKEAKEFIQKYFETYPGVKEYMEKEKVEAYNNGYVKTIMNRKRIISELSDSNYNVRSMGERMALNTPIQGSASDILKKAMIEIDNEFTKRNLKSKMLLQVHDELIFNVIKEELEIVKKIVYNIMTNVYQLSIPLDVDMEIGNNWYEAK